MAATADEVVAALVAPDGPNPSDSSSTVLDGALSDLADRLSARGAGALYSRWREHPAAKGGWTEQPWGAQSDLRLLDDLRAAEFWRLDSAKTRLTSLGAAADVLRAGAESLGRRLAEAWGTGAAPTSDGQFDRLARSARAWKDSLDSLAAALEGSRTVAAHALKSWSNDLGGTIRLVEVDDRALRLAQVDRIDAVIGGGAGTIAELRAPGLELNNPAQPWLAHEIVAYLDDLCTRYNLVVGRFRQGGQAVRQATERAWLTLADILGKIDRDPFAQFVAPPAPPSGTPAATGDQVVIRDDGRVLAVTGPDAQGRYSLSVQEGGLPRSYGLDFGQQNPVTFQDGRNTITAERMPDGVLKLGVDDGSGPPRTYTIEGDAPDKPQAPPTPPAPQQAPPSPPVDGSGGGSGSSGGSGGGAGGGTGGAGVGGGGGSGGGSEQSTPLAEGGATGARTPTGDDQPRSAPVGASAGAPGAPAGQGGMAGGMPMGGMGGGQQGGDNERKASRWQLQGNLFDSPDPEVNFEGIVGQDPANRA